MGLILSRTPLSPARTGGCSQAPTGNDRETSTGDEAGLRLLERVVKDLELVGQVEIPSRMEGRSMILLMVPRPQSGTARPPEKKPAAGANTPAPKPTSPQP